MVVTAARRRLGDSSLLAPLEVRLYRRWWFGRLASLAGEITLNVTVPTVVLGLTHSLGAWATVVMIQSVPRALLVLFGGVVVDRVRPRRTMLLTASVQAVMAATLLVVSLAAGLQRWHFWIWAAVNGALLALFLPAVNAFIPSTLPAGRVRAGNALYMSSQQAMAFAVPLLAGAFTAWAGISVAFAVAAVASGVFAVSLMTAHADDPRPGGARDSTGVRQVLDQLVAGLRTVRRDPVMAVLVPLIGLYMFGAGLIMWVGLPGLAELTFHGGSDLLGTFMSALGGGALLGSVAVGVVRRVHREALVGTALTVCFGTCLIGLARAPAPWAAAVLCLVSGACWSASSVLYTTLVQTRTPKDQLGRVMGVVTLALVGMEPLAFAVARWTGDSIGPRGLVLLGGVAVVLAGLAGLASRALRSSGALTPVPSTGHGGPVGPAEAPARPEPETERPELSASRAAGGR